MKKFLFILVIFLASCASSQKHKAITHTNIDSVSHIVKDSFSAKKDINISKDLTIYGIDEEVEDSITTIATTKDSSGKITTISTTTNRKIKRHADSAKNNTIIVKHEDTTHVKTDNDTKLKKTVNIKTKDTEHHGLGAGVYISGTIILLVLSAFYFVAKKLKWI